MEIDIEFVRYILSLQDISILERGTQELDREYLELIENSFPIIKEERKQKEFEEWLRTEKIEKLSPVKKIFLKALSTEKDSAFDAARLNRLLTKLDNIKCRYFKQFVNDPKILTEYKIFKSLKKLSETS